MVRNQNSIDFCDGNESYHGSPQLLCHLGDALLCGAIGRLLLEPSSSRSSLFFFLAVRELALAILDNVILDGNKLGCHGRWWIPEWVFVLVVKHVRRLSE